MLGNVGAPNKPIGVGELAQLLARTQRERNGAISNEDVASDASSSLGNGWKRLEQLLSERERGSRMTNFGRPAKKEAPPTARLEFNYAYEALNDVLKSDRLRNVADAGDDLREESLYKVQPPATPDTTSDYEALNGLLEADRSHDVADNRGNRREESLHRAQPPAAPDTTSDLFKSEIGKDESSATKEDYLVWVEKQMKSSEIRLQKLLKFYEFIKATPDFQ